MPEPGKNKDIPFIQGSWGTISQAHRFHHQAMGSSWEIIIQHEDAGYARQASLAAFDDLDRLESELSRFVENSDISRINKLQSGKAAVVGLDTFRCLQIAGQMYEKTGGAFDVTIGPLFRCWFDEDGSRSVDSKWAAAIGKNLRTPTEQILASAHNRSGMHLLGLDESEHSVKVKTGQLQVDLGGIGKGYAVDRIAEILKEWQLNRIFVNAGSSSVLALDRPFEMKGWPVTISSPFEPGNTLYWLFLKNFSLGGSGLQHHHPGTPGHSAAKLHIIDPRRGRPVQNRGAAWSGVPLESYANTTAAMTDALSTAFMIMSKEQIESYCSSNPETLAMTLGFEPRAQRRVWGPWHKYYK